VISFKKWLETSEKEELEARINTVLRQCGDVIFFMEKDGEIFGAPESSRVVFANMKNSGRSEMPAGWKDEATFMAYNLSRAVEGEEGTNVVLTKKDLKDIVVIDQAQAVDRLKKTTKGKLKPMKQESGNA
jgi:hypothetical protein